MTANLTPNPTPHRLGKIARLPWEIRQQLNERLADNEPGRRLLRWLNALPEVKEVLEQLFDGRPISQQNLSAWQLGGFRDWERYQATRARARDFVDEAEELEEELDDLDEPEEPSSLLDRVGDRMALALLQLFREAEEGEKGPARTREMLEITRELARMRRGDDQRRRSEVVQERWRTERETEARERYEKVQEQKKREVTWFRIQVTGYRDELIEGLAAGKLTPQREKSIREFFVRNEELLRELGIPGLPEEEALAAAVETMKEVLRFQETGRRQRARTDDEEPAAAGETASQTRPNKAAQGPTRRKIFSTDATGAGGKLIVES